MSNWNKRRGELIDKDIAGTISESERSELAELQERCDRWLAKVAPRPCDVLAKLEHAISIGPQRATPASVGRIGAEVKATKQQLEQDHSR